MGRKGAYFVLYHDALIFTAAVLSTACVVTQSTAVLDAMWLMMVLALVNEALIYKLYKIPRRVINHSLSTMIIMFSLFIAATNTVYLTGIYAVFFKPAFACALTVLTAIFMIIMLDDTALLRIVKSQ